MSIKIQPQSEVIASDEVVCGHLPTLLFSHSHVADAKITTEDAKLLRAQTCSTVENWHFTRDVELRHSTLGSDIRTREPIIFEVKSQIWVGADGCESLCGDATIKRGGISDRVTSQMRLIEPINRDRVYRNRSIVK